MMIMREQNEVAPRNDCMQQVATKEKGASRRSTATQLYTRYAMKRVVAKQLKSKTTLHRHTDH